MSSASSSEVSKAGEGSASCETHAAKSAPRCFPPFGAPEVDPLSMHPPRESERLALWAALWSTAESGVCTGTLPEKADFVRLDDSRSSRLLPYPILLVVRSRQWHSRADQTQTQRKPQEESQVRLCRPGWPPPAIYILLPH